MWHVACGMRNTRFARLLAVALLAAGLTWCIAATGAEETPRSSPKTSTSRTQPSTGGDAKLQAKLDKILETQERILKRLDEVMEELRIVKIRASIKR